MTDDQWRRRDGDDDFGPPLFGDESEGTLSFGDDTAEPMPHWTAPPTGEVPAMLGGRGGDADLGDLSEDVDVWSSFSGQAPSWRDSDDGAGLDDIAGLDPVFEAPSRGLFDDPADDHLDDLPGLDDLGGRPARSGRSGRTAGPDLDLSDLSDGFERPALPSRDREPAPIDLDDDYSTFDDDYGTFDDSDVTGPTGRAGGSGRIQIGTDPTEGDLVRTAPSGRRPRPSDGPPRGRQPRQPAPGRVPPRGGPGRPAPRPGAHRGASVQGRPKGGTGGRDMPTAVAMGIGLAAVFIAAIKFRPWAVAAIVVVVLGLGAVEYFDRVRDRGYQPAFVPGIVACIAAPVAVYHYGVGSLPLVMFLAFTAMAISFVAAPSLESNPMPNMAITSLGVTWIGILGSFGAAMLEQARVLGVPKVGTDTLCLLAIAVVANDVGALFVGSAVGRTPLRAWISPNKSIEGFVGGTVLTLGAMFLVSVSEISTTWNSMGDLLLLGLVVAVMAPVGDLTESMFKRNLDVKDFGTLVKGHGGVLDRFDGFLFTLPATYYLMVSLQPWVS